MSRQYDQRWKWRLIRGFALAVAICNTGNAYAFPAAQWVINPGEYVEIVRDFVCFGEGRAGYRTASASKQFSREVLSAEVMISGFNMWYTRERHDHAVLNENVDAWVVAIGLPDPDTGQVDRRFVALKFQYAMVDKDTSGSDDYNDACIGYTVMARTK